GHVDTEDRTIAVVDHTGVLYDLIAREADAHNREAATSADEGGGKYLVQRFDPAGRGHDELEISLSESVKAHQLFGFVDIPADVLDPPTGKKPEKKGLFSSRDSTERTFSLYTESSSAGGVTGWLEDAVNTAIAEHRLAAAGVDPAKVKELTAQVSVTR